MKAEAYSLFLYCDHSGCRTKAEGDHGYVGESRGAAWNKAKADGWMVKATRQFCKYHNPEQRILE